MVFSNEVTENIKTHLEEGVGENGEKVINRTIVQQLAPKPESIGSNLRRQMVGYGLVGTLSMIIGAAFM